MSEKSKILTFLLGNGISSTTWNPAERILTLVFRQEKILRIFCGLCYFVDVTNPDNATGQGTPGWVKDLIVGSIDHLNLTLRLRLSVDSCPRTLAVCLPEFPKDAPADETINVSCYEIALT